MSREPISKLLDKVRGPGAAAAPRCADAGRPRLRARLRWPLTAAARGPAQLVHWDKDERYMAISDIMSHLDAGKEVDTATESKCARLAPDFRPAQRPPGAAHALSA